MNTTFDILVIVLSCLLAIFLVLSIIAAVLVLKLVKSVRQMVESAEELGETLKRNAGAVGMVRMLMKLVSMANKVKK